MIGTEARGTQAAAPLASGDAAEAGSGFRADVEGLRAVAVALVVGYHAGVGLLPGGYVGVDVFFVLSGFLITGLLVREHARTRRISLPRFYARRARRLLPAATLTMAAVAVASWLLLPASRARDVAGDGLWSAVFAANLRFARTGTDYLSADAPPSPLQHYWSLAVEEQFYLLWPLLLLVVGLVARRRFHAVLRVVLVALVAGSLALSVHQTATDATWAYFSPFTRAFELGAGALVAVSLPLLLRLRRTTAAWLSLGGLAAVVLSSVAYDERTAFPGLAAALPVGGVALLLVGGTADPAGRVQTWLSAGPLQWLGARSYSWYLWHWPVLILASGHVERDLTAVERLACVSLSLALAALSHTCVENPVRHLAPLVRSPRASLAMGLSLVVGMVAGFQGLASAGDELSDKRQTAAAQRAHDELLSAPLPTLPRLLADVRATSTTSDAAIVNARFATLDMHPASADHCQAGPRTWALPPADACWYGDPRAKRVVVLLGDSHASMWLPALDLLGKRDGFRLHHLAKTSCPAVDVLTVHKELKRPFTECTRFRKAAFARIVQLRPALVVISSSRNDGDVVVRGTRLQGHERLSAWEHGLTSTLQQLSRSGARLAVLGDIPFQTPRALDCLESRVELRRCGTSRDAAVDPAFLQVEREAARRAGATYVELTPLLCTASRCPIVVGDLVAYYDKRHVTASFALRAAGVLGTWLRV